MAKEGKPSSLRLTGAFKKMIELLMRERHFNDRTAYFEQLVREDWDDRATPQMQAEMTKWLALQPKDDPTPQRAPAVQEVLPSKSGTAKTKGISRKSRSPERASN